MKTITLTQGKVAIVDDENYERLNQFKWCASKCRNSFYAVRNIRVNKKVKKILMHRVIMNASIGIQVDHRNGDGLFNCEENLRFCTNQENHFNIKKPHKDNKLGIKGIYWNKNNKKFHAQIQVNKKSVHLGFFNILGDADSAYRKAEDKYFGEFARGV